ncbi:hypothetical protein [Pseudobutyrivibrio ruminis]|uniref:hypothetical protein n=1 Tax=Pseudobutyrivibrio ruminis TaxID=46206 RepID=UPI0004137EAC|nr:hypothetical protein [Pseudobutyrivibrio ruminis]
MSNIEKKEMENVYNYYKDKYRVDWIPNEDFDYEGDPKYYEECPRLIIYFSKAKEYAILADVDEVDLLKKIVRFKKEKWVSMTHSHPDGEFTEDGKEIIRIIDSFISKAI